MALGEKWHHLCSSLQFLPKKQSVAMDFCLASEHVSTEPLENNNLCQASRKQYSFRYVFTCEPFGGCQRG